MLVRQYTLCTEHEDVLGFIPSYVLYFKQIGNVYARCCLQETLLLSENLFFWTAANKTKFKIKSFLFRLSCVLQIKSKQCRKLHQNMCTEIKNCVQSLLKVAKVQKVFYPICAFVDFVHFFRTGWKWKLNISQGVRRGIVESLNYSSGAGAWSEFDCFLKI